MDFYANDSLGPWTVNNEVHRPQRTRKPRTKIRQEVKIHTASSCVETGCCSQKPECCRGEDINENPFSDICNNSEYVKNVKTIDSNKS